MCGVTNNWISEIHITDNTNVFLAKTSLVSYDNLCTHAFETSYIFGVSFPFCVYFIIKHFASPRVS